MNIFVLDYDPKVAASLHCDTHVVKMILETAQMLSTSHHILDGEDSISDIYKATHKNHPCNVWVRESSSNYEWLLTLGFSLCREYTKRYGKRHKTQSVLDNLRVLPKNIPKGPLTPFARAMPEEYKVTNPVESYRRYYIGEKSSIAKYKYTEKPLFMCA